MIITATIFLFYVFVIYLFHSFYLLFIYLFIYSFSGGGGGGGGGHLKKIITLLNMQLFQFFFFYNAKSREMVIEVYMDTHLAILYYFSESILNQFQNKYVLGFQLMGL